MAVLVERKMCLWKKLQNLLYYQICAAFSQREGVWWLFLSADALFHEQRGEEDKDIGLDETIEQIKVQAEDGRHEHRDHQLDELHDDESAQHVAEQSHTQAGGADGDLEDVHGGHDGGGGGEALEEALAAPGMDAGILDEADAHERQRSGDIQILRGGLDAEHADQVAEGDVDGHGHQVRHIAPALFAQQTFKEISACEVGHFQHGLTLADMVHLQVSGKQDRADGDDGQDHPADDHGFRDLQRADLDVLDGELFHQGLGQLVHLFFLLPEEWGPGLRVGSGDVLPRKRAAPRTGSTPSYRMKKRPKNVKKARKALVFKALRALLFPVRSSFSVQYDSTIDEN